MRAVPGGAVIEPRHHLIGDRGQGGELLAPCRSATRELVPAERDAGPRCHGGLSRTGAAASAPSYIASMESNSMEAIVLDAPGPPEALRIRQRPIPVPQPGQVLIKVKAFGLNRSELHTRLGLADGVTFPRVPGIEATGVVAAAPGGEFAVGQQVFAMMGGMGRTFDGGYAQYTCVPAAQVIAFTSDLDWATLGAVPEMLQTAYGALTAGLDAQPGQSLLVRGGTSSVGMAAAILAKRRGMTVLSTTRNPAKADALRAIGVDHVLVDDGDVAGQVRAILPDGVDNALELVGTPTLPDTLRSAGRFGVVCMAGMLSNEWIVPNFYPIGYIPRGVRLTGYGGDADDLPPAVLQDFLDAVAAGEAVVPLDRTYRFDQIVQAHTDMEAGVAVGKFVVLVEDAA
jgi:NADPH2:quinone reductase